MLSDQYYLIRTLGASDALDHTSKPSESYISCRISQTSVGLFELVLKRRNNYQPSNFNFEIWLIVIKQFYYNLLANPI